MSRPELFKFRLYIAQDAPNSVLAIANLLSFCRAYLPDQHEIEIVDVFKEPRRALAEAIFMTPTLIKLAPAPMRRVVGTLSQIQILVNALGLEALAA